MNSWVMAVALLCLTVLGGLALWLTPGEAGNTIAAASVGAIGGALAAKGWELAKKGGE